MKRLIADSSSTVGELGLIIGRVMGMNNIQEHLSNPYQNLIPLWKNNGSIRPDRAVANRELSGTVGTQKPDGECKTCRERRYVDGSNEGNVSFKAPGHISPEASMAVVSAHEGEHVANARREGNEEGKELVSATVTLKMGVCPECHKSYVAGGVTRTTIASVSKLPYNNMAQKVLGDMLQGNRIDERV